MDEFPINTNIKGVPQPDRPCEFVPLKAGETFLVGSVKFRILEDGSHTDNRISIVEITVPPHTPGPPAHWHEMHDEVFYTTKGKLRFHVPASHPIGTVSSPPDPPGKHIDAAAGEMVTVPTRAPHTFSNPFDEEAVFINTFTPAFYVNFLKMIRDLTPKGGNMVPAVNAKAFAHFGTVLADLGK